MSIPYYDEQTLSDLLPWTPLIDAVEAAFLSDAVAPTRSHHEMSHGTMLIMPAWDPDAYTGVKLVTINPANRARGLSTLHGVYVLFDGATGRPIATMDGRALTLRRTAAASAVAARHLAKRDARSLLMVGAGDLAPFMIRAHASVRPIDQVILWNRTRSHADALKSKLVDEFRNVVVSNDLPSACSEADIICCATQASSPLVFGKDLSAHVHLDLVGAYTPAMIEADAACLTNADVVVDILDGAKSEAGDLLQAAAKGTWQWEDLAGDLAAVLRKGVVRQHGRSVFKSVGSALEDLAAAALAFSRAST